MRLFLPIPVLLMAVALLALLAAIWLALRRPPVVPTPKQRGSWHAARAGLSAVSATFAALCVLLIVGAMK